MAATMVRLTTFSSRTNEHGTVIISAAKVAKMRTTLERNGIVITGSRVVRSF